MIDMNLFEVNRWEAQSDWGVVQNWFDICLPYDKIRIALFETSIVIWLQYPWANHMQIPPFPAAILPNILTLEYVNVLEI